MEIGKHFNIYLQQRGGQLMKDEPEQRLTETLHQINTLVENALRPDFSIDDMPTYIAIIHRLIADTL